MAATSVQRLHGHYAICAVGSVTLTLFDWEMEIRTDYVDGTGHGDIWDIPIPLKYNWTARARGFLDISGTTMQIQNRPYLAQFAPQAVGSPPPDQMTVSFVAYASSDTSIPIFHGTGLITRAHFAAPEAMAEQEIELRGYGTPPSIP